MVSLKLRETKMAKVTVINKADHMVFLVDKNAVDEKVPGSGRYGIAPKQSMDVGFEFDIKEYPDLIDVSPQPKAKAATKE